MTKAFFNEEHCHECGLHVEVPELAEKQKALCPRCGYLFAAKHKNPIERTLIFSLTALVLLVISLSFDFLTFKTNGIERTITLLTSVNVLIDNHYAALAVVQVITIFVIPILVLCGLIYLSCCLHFHIKPPYEHFFQKGLSLLLPWNMAEIFIISVLVSLIKIIALADITLEPAFYVFILFSLFMLAALLHFDQRIFTRYFQVHSADSDVENQHKSIVGAASEIQTKNSIQRTWALLITSVLLYIPANVYPIMNTQLLGQEDPSTIIGGIILLWLHGSYPIAFIIFFASVFVPMSKIVVLAWLNYSVQQASPEKTQERIKLYRIAEFVGRWSMVDVFVVIVIVSLVQLGDTMKVLPGYAITAFCGVVVLTMLAAMSFDPKLIYRPLHNEKTTNNEC